MKLALSLVSISSPDGQRSIQPQCAAIYLILKAAFGSNAIMRPTLEVSGSNYGQKSAILTEVFHSFPQFSQENAGTVIQIGLQSIPSTFFHII
jgi:hypothetical protein